jgi:ADP-heptose:LPS heptosyltransferase
MKILLLQLKRIGDLILTIPSIAALRERFPEAHITMVVSSECGDLLPAISGVDRILMARRNLSDLAAFLAVAGNKFDYCIDFTGNDRSALLAFLSQARQRIVSHRVRDQSKSRARVYTDFIKQERFASAAIGVATRGARKGRCASSEFESAQAFHCITSRFGPARKALGNSAMEAAHQRFWARS